jgi:hypothetical protein
MSPGSDKIKDLKTAVMLPPAQDTVCQLNPTLAIPIETMVVLYKEMAIAT